MIADTPAQRIRQIMRRRSLTQRELSEVLGISQPAVSLYLQGRMPPADILYRIARLDNRTVDWLLSGEESVTARSVGEQTVPYGNQAVLIPLWVQLSPRIQRDMLNLMRHLVEANPK